MDHLRLHHGDHFFFFFSLPFLLSSILFLLLIFVMSSGRKVSNSSSKLGRLPPGPWRVPLIGSFHHLVGHLPHRRLRELSQRYGPLMYLQLGQIPTIVVSSAEMAKEVLKTHDVVFAHRPRLPVSEIVFYGPSDIVFSPVGHHWKLLRKIASQELLNATRVRSLQAVWEKEVSSLMNTLSMEVGSCVNLSEKLFVTICGISSKSTFGKKQNYKGQLEEIMLVSELISNSATELYVSELFPSWKWLHIITGVSGRTREMCRKIDLVLQNIIVGEESKDVIKEEEGGGGGECLLKTLLNMKDQGDLTINQVKAVILDMITAGTDAPPTLIEWAMAEMIRSPKVMKKAQEEVRQVYRSKGYINETIFDELEYLKAVIKETLRLHPPPPLMAPRESTQTCEINGYTIQSGTQLLVNVWAIGRDPKYWGTSAEEFLPERFLNSPIDYKGFNFEFIPFGSGKRVCPGMSFGVASVEIVLANLLCHFDWELPGGTTPETLDMTEYMSSTLGRKNNLILIPISYNPISSSIN